MRGEGLLLRLLGGSWVVLSGVTSPRIWVVVIIVTLLITPLITTHEPPSTNLQCKEL